MSEIHYVNRLGDALDAMADVAAATVGGPALSRFARPRRPSAPSPQVPRGRTRLLVGIAVVLIGGGVATAATLLSKAPAVLAARGLTCDYGPPSHYTDQAFDVEEGTRTPAQACAAIERVPASKLVACASAKYGVVVYDRNGSASECQGAGMSTLPVGYATAARRVATLVDDLNRLQASQNCFTEKALVAATQSTLDTLGFLGWHAEIFSPPGSSGTSRPAWPCAQYPGSGGRYSDAASAISYDYSGRARVVAVVSGPSRRVDLAIRAVNQRNLLGKTGERCYSLSALQALVRVAVRASFGARTPVTFAAASEPPSGMLAFGRQPRYEAGCAVLVGVGPTPGGAVQAMIWQKGWPPPNQGNGVPNSAYKPVLHRP